MLNVEYITIFIVIVLIIVLVGVMMTRGERVQRERHQRERFEASPQASQQQTVPQAVPKIVDSISSPSSMSVAGINNDAIKQTEKKTTRPPLFSLHIFPQLDDNTTFVQNGVKYIRCIGEQIPKDQVDKEIQQMLGEETVFQAPDYRQKNLKQVYDKNTFTSNIRLLTEKNFPKHQHHTIVKQPLFSQENNSLYGNQSKGSRDNDFQFMFHDKEGRVSIKTQNVQNDKPSVDENGKEKVVQSDVSQYKMKDVVQLNVEDKSVDVIYCMVIGYIAE